MIGGPARHSRECRAGKSFFENSQNMSTIFRFDVSYRQKKAEVVMMIEESEFTKCYQDMIGTICLTPEHSEKQLSKILQRVVRLQKPPKGESSMPARRNVS